MTAGSIRGFLAKVGASAVVLLSSAPAPAQEDPADCIRGYNDHWGEDPRCPPSYESGTAAAYNPRYISVVIIDLESGWKANVHHASFPLHPPSMGNTANYRLDLALDVISWVLKGSPRKLGHIKFRDFRKLDHVPYKRLGGTYKDKRHIPSFDDFAFANQNEIFIFLRNADIELNKKRLIRFTQYSENKPELMAKNYSFFNARSIEGDSLGSLKNSGKLIRVENHLTNPDSTPITTHPLSYSMNIHFKMRIAPELGADERFVPMIIDPDTGNGTGNEP